MLRELPMPNKQHIVDLSEDERAELESFVSSGVEGVIAVLPRFNTSLRD